jgi:hypothetical protein
VSRLAVQRLFAMDEARFGLKATHRRQWCPFGSRPPWVHDHQYHWFWLYAAVEPVSGTCFVLFLPHVDGACFERFLEELRRHTGTDRIAPNSIRRSAGSKPCAGSSPTRCSTPWKTSKPP